MFRGWCVPLRCECVYSKRATSFLIYSTRAACDVQALSEAIAWGCSIAQLRNQVHQHFVVEFVRPMLDARSETVRMQGMYSCRPRLAFTSSDAMLSTPVLCAHLAVLILPVPRVTLEIAAANAPKDGTRIRGDACHVAAMPAFTPW
jgi:hypothetical protein